MRPNLIHSDRRAVQWWLALCLLLVACMVLVGGYTRLSGSGLSITEWKPIHGVIPPLNEPEWIEEFEAYKQSPQYRKVNRGMTLGEFKAIFWPEYWHRVLGRIIGAVFLIPLLLFTVRRSFSAGFGFRLFLIFLLGGLQGLAGWLMVKSGLIDDPRVSHLRLALHLSLAFLIFALLLWALLDLRKPQHARLFTGQSLKRNTGKGSFILWFFFLCLQIVVGAFVAGLHGGLIYNTWPTMNGAMAPPDLMALTPWYANFIENIATIQFIHRMLAIFVVAAFLLWWSLYGAYVKYKHLGKVCAAVAAVLAAQFTLGVLTLLSQAALPLALAHQMTALLLFALAVTLLHRIHSDA